MNISKKRRKEMKSKKVVKSKKEEGKGEWFNWRPQMPIVFVDWKTKRVGIYYALGTENGKHEPQMKTKGL